VNTPIINNQNQEVLQQQQQQQQLQMQYNKALLQQQQNELLSLTTNNPVPEINYKNYFTAFADDIKLAAIVFCSVVIAHFIPIEKYLSKYLAIDKIPYHDIIFRSIFAAILVLFIKKFVLKI
jgi:hypothetical protein